MELIKKVRNYIWSSNFLFNMLGIILVYVIGIWILRGCISLSTNHGQKIEVPDLVGKNQNNLPGLLNNTQLKYEILDSIYDPTKIAGTILSQDPLPTSESKVYVKEGRMIQLSVSKRTQLIEVPDLVDKSQRFAETILRSRKFRYSIDYKPSKEAHGAVIQQLYKNKPVEPGVEVPIGSRIKLIIGRDDGGIVQVLPNLYGLTIEEARQRVGQMVSMEFLVACPEGYTKADSLEATVQSQSPEYTEGAPIISGTTITVYAAKPAEEGPTNSE